MVIVFYRTLHDRPGVPPASVVQKTG
jgi:hypothetical protein